MFQCFYICTFALWFQYSNCESKASKFKNHPEEEAGKLPQGMQKISDNIKRRERTFINKLENLPYDLVILWAAFLFHVFAFISGSKGDEKLALIILIWVTSFSRVLYTFCY